MAVDSIGAYGAGSTAENAVMCRRLRAEIDAALPKAVSKVWHAMPVWFLGDTPVVGYKVSSKGVTLLFWNGQSFGESELSAVGKFKAAQIQFTAAAQMDERRLRRWLKKAGTDLWDATRLRQRPTARS
jgi:hypothetical protein